MKARSGSRYVCQKKKLTNLIAIVDYNGVQLDGFCCEIVPLPPLQDKWEAFGWRVLEVNGHNIII